MQLTCLLLAVAIAQACATPTTITLDGTDWTFSDDTGANTGKAKVPGGIYSDLYNSGILGDDPLKGNNDVTFRWVARQNWSFSKIFNVTEDILSKGAVSLVLNGVDTVSSVYINGKLVGKTDNMFVSYKFDIKSVLQLGLNKIMVKISSPIAYAKEQNNKYLKAKFYDVPPFCPASVQNGECHFNFIRKMHCSFSWDWGPAFPSSGIWKSIEVEAVDQLIIKSIMVTTQYSWQTKLWHLDIAAVTEHSSNSELSVNVGIKLDNFNLGHYNLTLKPSKRQFKSRMLLTVQDTPFPIELWWPNGVNRVNSTGQLEELGRKLYNLTLLMNATDGHLPQVAKTVRIGFRTIELIQDPVEPTGATFYFKVNGVPLFMKGSNWIPAEVLPETVTEEYVKSLLTIAQKSNMNMLRVWGGGVYESDYFYQVADELGILIWQDMMYACSLYPTDDDFLVTVKTEITQQIQRLQHHPSIAIWAGNNENEAAISGKWWPEVIFGKKTYTRDYVTLYINTIKPIVESEDPSRIFLPSSPSNGPQTEKEGWVSSNPQDTRWGDVHFYDYLHNNWDWTTFPSSKFTSEYGLQSLPSLKSWLKAVNASELEYPINESKALNHRQHSVQGGIGLLLQVDFNLHLPAKGNVERFADFVYLSQITQAYAYKVETEFYRRNRNLDSSGNGFTMGALYWQLNDVWVAPSWSSTDHGGKWKMAQYYAQNFFAPVIAVPFVDSGYLNVDVVNDVIDNVQVRVTLSVYHWSSLNSSWSQEISANVTGGKVSRVLSMTLSDVLETAACHDASNCVIRTVLTMPNSSYSSENVLLLSSPKKATGISKSSVRIVNVQPLSANSSSVFSIELSTDAICLFVWLDFRPESEVDGQFTDNGFILFEPNKTIQFTALSPDVSADEISKSIIVRSLTDVVTDT
ncbi:Beta-mannosidase [Halotydeus destructor]|nr:Beta-mannosidase [Halotydeus destructor]